MGMGEPFLNVDASPRVGSAPSRPRDHATVARRSPRSAGCRACAASWTRSRSRSASRSRSTRPIREALGAHARERPLPAGRCARRVPPLRRAPPAQGVRRVRHARRREDSRGGRAGARGRARRGRSRSTSFPYNPTHGCLLTGRPLRGRLSEGFRSALERAIRATVRLTLVAYWKPRLRSPVVALGGAADLVGATAPVAPWPGIRPLGLALPRAPIGLGSPAAGVEYARARPSRRARRACLRLWLRKRLRAHQRALVVGEAGRCTRCSPVCAGVVSRTGLSRQGTAACAAVSPSAGMALAGGCLGGLARVLTIPMLAASSERSYRR